MTNANAKALARLTSSEPVLTDVLRASEVCGVLRDRTLLHAGPPIAWERMCGPMRGAAECAVVYEGWANSYDAARIMLESGQVQLAPTHDHGFVGPVAGVVSPSMWVFCVRNATYGNAAYCTMSEGVGRALRFGAQGEDVLKRLKWMEEVLAPVLSEALRDKQAIDLKDIIRQSLEMGDECHNRHEAARLLLLRNLVPPLLSSPRPAADLTTVFDFIADNYYFFVNLAMAASKATLDPLREMPGSTIVTAMARNGTDFGIRVAGLGDDWFTAPCNRIDGVYFDGYDDTDANPDLGDSSITETAGLGAFAMAGAPAICKYIGGTPSEMLGLTYDMYKITVGEHPHFRIPAIGFRGTPVGVDVCAVVDTGIAPVINSSIAHRNPGVGQIGAGLVRAPLECFRAAHARLSKPETCGADGTNA